MLFHSAYHQNEKKACMYATYVLIYLCVCVCLLCCLFDKINSSWKFIKNIKNTTASQTLRIYKHTYFWYIPYVGVRVCVCVHTKQCMFCVLCAWVSDWVAFYTFCYIFLWLFFSSFTRQILHQAENFNKIFTYII